MKNWKQAKTLMIKEMTNNNVIIFDCDGTILDTFGLIEACTIETFKTVLPNISVSKEEVHAFFGPLLNDSFKKYTKNDLELKACIDTYRKLTMDLHPEYVKAYPGIKALIAFLKAKGFKLAIVSNKVSEAIIYGLVLNGMEKDFDLIIGAEKMSSPKPHPDGVHQILNYFKVNKALLVGDTKFDIESGFNATNETFLVKTVGVTWCQATYEDFVRWGANFIINEPKELIEIVEGFYDL